MKGHPASRRLFIVSLAVSAALLSTGCETLIKSFTLSDAVSDPSDGEVSDEIAAETEAEGDPIADDGVEEDRLPDEQAEEDRVDSPENDFIEPDSNADGIEEVTSLTRSVALGWSVGVVANEAR